MTLAPDFASRLPRPSCRPDDCNSPSSIMKSCQSSPQASSPYEWIGDQYCGLDTRPYLYARRVLESWVLRLFRFVFTYCFSSHFSYVPGTSSGFTTLASKAADNGWPFASRFTANGPTFVPICGGGFVSGSKPHSPADGS